MSDATPLPRVGDVFFDERGEDRALRLSWHPDAQVMVLSIWNRGVCTGTFRLPAGDIPALLEQLSQGVPEARPRGRRHADEDLPVPRTPYVATGQYDVSERYGGGREPERAPGGHPAEPVYGSQERRPAYAARDLSSAGGYAGQYDPAPPARGGTYAPAASQGGAYGSDPLYSGAPAGQGTAYGSGGSSGQATVYGSAGSGGGAADPLEVLKSLGAAQAAAQEAEPRAPRTGEYSRPRHQGY